MIRVTIILAAVACCLWVALASASPSRSEEQVKPPKVMQIPAGFRLMCGVEKEILDYMAKRHDEKPIWEGSDTNGFRALLTVGGGGAWTIIVFQPSLPGLACVLVGGEKSTVFDKAPRPEPKAGPKKSKGTPI